LKRVRVPAGLALAALVIGLITVGWKGVVSAAALGLAGWLLAGAFAIPVRRWWAGRANLTRSIRTTPPAVMGLSLAHAGLGLLLLGITGVTAWHSDKVLTMRPGDTTTFAGRSLTLESVSLADGPNYQARQARFEITGRGGPYTLVSERRAYATSQTTEAAIHVSPVGNLYISGGDEEDGGIVVRLWDHPLIVWIWIGGFTMALGGLISLSDRRLRLGVAARAPAPQLVPATPIPMAGE
jgi:cytochrome c-type biogenesis protein CcmF